ncbi:MAG TPA: ectoine/hydroxyectoine ABC transporter permease subunit EhuC [Candidatus Dormibacteraeota bacterium]|jgi:polar amino acid transport system permease protein|nr:ectoine/hydroxyectoine ABC transporter permease subunit EhuC [Candidatus Dormibacteraeota bacterium]
MIALVAGRSLSQYLPLLLGGIPVTLEVTGMAIVLVVIFGFLFGLGRSSRSILLRLPSGLLVEVLRGSSAIVQLFWAFYVLPFLGVDLSPLTAGVLVLGLNGGAYFSEVVRAGLASVPHGQIEASVTLHLSPWYRFRRVILPQSLPVMVPPFGNALIDMLKFSALLSLVTIHDLAYRADAIGSVIPTPGPVYGITLALYFAMALGLSAIVSVIESQVNRWAGRAVRARRPFARTAGPVPRWAFPGR